MKFRWILLATSTVLLGALLFQTVRSRMNPDVALPAPELQKTTAATLQDKETHLNKPAENPSEIDSSRSFKKEGAPKKSAALGSITQKSSLTAEAVANNRTTDASDSSFGDIKVLAARGCDVNTQGWFLSVGSPQDYNYDVSKDGQTVSVEPNTSPLSGNFELVHCADMSDLAGKRGRFSALVKRQDVTQTALLRLRGENVKKERILFETANLRGTSDWKRISIESDVSPDVTLLSYGLTYRSTGKLWMKDATLSVVR